MEYELKRIPLAPALKILFFVYLIVGFILGIFYGIMLVNFLSIVSSSLQLGEELLKEFSSLGFAGIIMMGIMMALFSSVILTAITILGLASYNLLAGWLGGLKFQLESAELDNVLYEEVEVHD